MLLDEIKFMEQKNDELKEKEKQNKLEEFNKFKQEVDDAIARFKTDDEFLKFINVFKIYAERAIENGDKHVIINKRIIHDCNFPINILKGASDFIKNKFESEGFDVKIKNDNINFVNLLVDDSFTICVSWK